MGTLLSLFFEVCSFERANESSAVHARQHTLGHADDGIVKRVMTRGSCSRGTGSPSSCILPICSSIASATFVRASSMDEPNEWHPGNAGTKAWYWSLSGSITTVNW